MKARVGVAAALALLALLVIQVARFSETSTPQPSPGEHSPVHHDASGSFSAVRTNLPPREAPEAVTADEHAPKTKPAGKPLRISVLDTQRWVKSLEHDVNMHWAELQRLEGQAAETGSLVDLAEVTRHLMDYERFTELKACVLRGNYLIYEGPGLPPESAFSTMGEVTIDGVPRRATVYIPGDALRNRDRLNTLRAEYHKMRHVAIDEMLREFNSLPLEERKARLDPVYAWWDASAAYAETPKPSKVREPEAYEAWRNGKPARPEPYPIPDDPGVMPDWKNREDYLLLRTKQIDR